MSIVSKNLPHEGDSTLFRIAVLRKYFRMHGFKILICFTAVANLTWLAAHNLEVQTASEVLRSSVVKEIQKYHPSVVSKKVFDAQLKLADMYLKGEGDTQNIEKGVGILKQAATAGNLEAAYRLGQLYANGVGSDAMVQTILGNDASFNPTKELPQDYAKAFVWYLQAAEQGSAKAQSALGMLYHAGNGVKEDNVIAYKLETLALAMGFEEAKPLQDQVVDQLTLDQLTDVQQSIQNWGNVTNNCRQIVEDIVNTH